MLEKFVVINLVSNRSESTVNFTNGVLKFNKSTAPELGYPPFVQLLWSEQDKKLAIRPCKEGDPNAVAFSRPASAKSYPIPLHVAAAYNQAVKTMGWSTDKYYIVQGENYSKENAIVYDLKTAEEFEPKQRGSKDASTDEVDNSAATE